MPNLQDLNDDDFVVIDMTTGTVLGTNLRAIQLEGLPYNLESLCSSDTLAAETAEKYGVGLRVDL